MPVTIGQTCMSVTRAAGGILCLLRDLRFDVDAQKTTSRNTTCAQLIGDITKASQKPSFYILPPLLPSSAVSGSLGDLGLVGLEGLPEPAAPPLLINTKVPEMAMPAGPMLIKPPEAMMVSSRPASMTTFMPALRCISMPASWA